LFEDKKDGQRKGKVIDMEEHGSDIYAL